MSLSSQPPDSNARTARVFHARFHMRSESTGDVSCALLFFGVGAEGRVEIRFSGVSSHDLPCGLELVFDDLELAADGARRSQQGSTTRSFRIESRGRCYRIEARSVQVHEHPRLYGTALRLPRFGMRRRALWTLLLWIAGYEWGQRLIRHLRRPPR